MKSVVTRSARSLAILAALLMTLAGAARADGLAALVTDARGKVEIQKPGQAWSAASVMAQAPAGSQIRVAAGGRAALAFVQGGLKVQLTGPVTVRVDASGATLVSGAAANVTSSKPGARTAVMVSGGVNINKMGGVLSRGGTPDPVLLTGPAVTSATPLLHWGVTDDQPGKPSGAFKQFNLRITDEKGAALVDETFPSSVREFRVPAGKLQVGASYRVRLTALPPIGFDGNQVRRRLFVLDPETAAGLEAAQREADAAVAAHPDDLSPLVLLTWMYLDHDVNGAALPLAERILKARPDSRDAQEILYRLYLEMGESIKAADLQKRTGIILHE